MCKRWHIAHEQIFDLFLFLFSLLYFGILVLVLLLAQVKKLGVSRVWDFNLYQEKNNISIHNYNYYPYCHFCHYCQYHIFFTSLIKRPGAAGAVLQKPLSLMNWCMRQLILLVGVGPTFAWANKAWFKVTFFIQVSLLFFW